MRIPVGQKKRNPVKTFLCNRLLGNVFVFPSSQPLIRVLTNLCLLHRGSGLSKHRFLRLYKYQSSPPLSLFFPLRNVSVHLLILSVLSFLSYRYWPIVVYDLCSTRCWPFPSRPVFTYVEQQLGSISSTFYAQLLRQQSCESKVQTYNVSTKYLRATYVRKSCA